MGDPSAQRGADRPRVGAVPAGGDLVGRDARGGLGRAEEGLGRGHVAVLAQHGVHEVAVAIDRPIQIRPAAPNLQVGIVDVPAPAAGTAPAVAPTAERVGQGGREFTSQSRTAS